MFRRKPDRPPGNLGPNAGTTAENSRLDPGEKNAGADEGARAHEGLGRAAALRCEEPRRDDRREVAVDAGPVPLDEVAHGPGEQRPPSVPARAVRGE